VKIEIFTYAFFVKGGALQKEKRKRKRANYCMLEMFYGGREK
jgi:hypothetical protein